MIKNILNQNPLMLIKKRLKIWCKFRTWMNKLLKGCVLSGIFGTGNGATSFSENIGAIAITRVASRYVMAISGLALIFLSEWIWILTRQIKIFLYSYVYNIQYILTSCKKTVLLEKLQISNSERFGENLLHYSLRSQILWLEDYSVLCSGWSQLRSEIELIIIFILLTLVCIKFINMVIKWN